MRAYVVVIDDNPLLSVAHCFKDDDAQGKAVAIHYKKKKRVVQIRDVLTTTDRNSNITTQQHQHTAISNKKRTSIDDVRVLESSGQALGAVALRCAIRSRH